MPTLTSLFFVVLELELLLDPEPSPESPHAARVSAATDITAATFIV
jgi:hypothetical protein